MRRVSRDSLFVVVLGLGVACRSASTPARSSELSAVSAAAAIKRTSSAFHARIGEPGALSDTVRSDSALRAWVSLRLRGDEFHYHIRLQKHGAFQVTEAVVASRADADGLLTPVVVLFRDARFRDRFLEVRGLGVVLPSMVASAIAEEIQSRPSAFVVLLKGPGGERWMAPFTEDR